MDRFTAVERALRDAAPHALLDALRASLARHFGALTVDLLMADYGTTILQPVGSLPYPTDPFPVHSTEPGRAFASQQPRLSPDEHAGTVTAHLPVTVRGDRLGVLSVTLPGEGASPEALGELRQLCEALGREVLVADHSTDVYLKARRAERLTLAAEMQWQLLPGRSCSGPEYELGAQLEPAYAVFGDNFDWSVSADHLTVTLTDGMGEGVDAALLTNLALSALRNARRAGLDLVGQAVLADQAVYGQHRGAAHVSVLLLRIHLATGRLEAVDAGSPRIWRLRGGAVEPVELEAQLPLGMFEDTPYAVQHFRIEAGDRLLFASDGVYEVASPSGERFGERALARAMTSTRLLPPSQVPRAVLGELARHRGEPPADDDAMVVCLDWHGRRS
ncbi:PP2C family protein-serine/threonine phosphatase [Streptomyces mangrovi]|uniref:PP2C family protein-serine/threonine phosphatase n=1 Tax=Streptomyces mangrovi TaxID=1206892 RepID=UPI00399D4A27